MNEIGAAIEEPRVVDGLQPDADRIEECEDHVPLVPGGRVVFGGFSQRIVCAVAETLAVRGVVLGALLQRLALCAQRLRRKTVGRTGKKVALRFVKKVERAPCGHVAGRRMRLAFPFHPPAAKLQLAVG